jgi:hypothetical protein
MGLHRAGSRVHPRWRALAARAGSRGIVVAVSKSFASASHAFASTSHPRSSKTAARASSRRAA